MVFVFENSTHGTPLYKNGEINATYCIIGVLSIRVKKRKMTKLRKKYLQLLNQGMKKLNCFSLRKTGFSRKKLKDISEKNQAEEKEALALCGARFVGFEHVHRPRNAEAHDHQNFKEFRHIQNSFFFVGNSA